MSAPRPLRAAMIDLDGTLVDTLGDFEAALAPTLAELGLRAVDTAFVRATIGKGSEHLVRRTLVHCGGDEGLFDAAWARFQHHYARVNGSRSHVFAGVVEGLQALRALGLALACLTNKPGRHARALLAAKELAPYFAAVHGGDAYPRRKPDPLPLLETCKALGSTPAQTLMVGDSANDAAAARAAGCPVVLMRYGYNHGQPVEAVGADALFDRLDELPAWLARAGYCCGPG